MKCSYMLEKRGCHCTNLHTLEFTPEILKCGKYPSETFFFVLFINKQSL